MEKNDLVKNIKKGEVVTRFWYMVKNLHPRCMGYHLVFVDVWFLWNILV
jgi:hypothetical protein